MFARSPKTTRCLLLIGLLYVPALLFSQDIDYAKEIISSLASPEFKGRGYVGNGNKIAAKYIREEYSKIGLKPFGKDYFQEFSIQVNTFPKKVALKFDGTSLIPGKDFIISPSSPSLKGEFETMVIKKSDVLDDESFRNILTTAMNKILVIDEREPTIEKDKNPIEERLNFLKYSPETDFAGIAIITSGKLTWSNLTFQSPRPVFIVKKEIEPSQLKRISVDVDAKFIDYKTNNIIGYIEGSEVPDSFLVVTAHYDHLGKMGKETYFPGANDNASGVAMILSLAKYFKQHTPKYSVAFIALSAEEIGIIGAKYYTENPLFELSRIKFLINFDLAGTGDDGIKVVNGSVYKKKFEELQAINEANNLLKSIQIRGEACNSDHCMFHRKGVPCFYIYTLGGIAAYHDIYDKAETLPLTEFEDYSKLMIGFLEDF